MTTEEKLRDLILTQYKSLLEFTESINMPYGTLQSIFKRGIYNSSVTNIIKICESLGISTDELAKGNIVPLSPKRKVTTELDSIITFTRMNVNDGTLTIDRKPLKQSEMHTLLDAIEIGVGIIKRNRERAKIKK